MRSRCNAAGKIVVNRRAGFRRREKGGVGRPWLEDPVRRQPAASIRSLFGNSLKSETSRSYYAPVLILLQVRYSSNRNPIMPLKLRRQRERRKMLSASRGRPPERCLQKK